MAKNQRTSEAPESNAGDDFHVVWTVKRSFDLLNFDKDGLKMISVEDIDPKGALKADPYGNTLLGVDLAEYYGGKDFNTASKVVISQLKYSTRKVNTNYTFSELYKGKKKKHEGSILHRFAELFSSFLTEYGRDEVLNKVEIKLISNRGVSNNHKKILTKLKNELIKTKAKKSTNSLVKSFPNYKTIIEKLKNATGLKSTEFTDYLRLLNFEDCGVESSIHQEMEGIDSMRKIGLQKTYHYDKLFRSIWKKMLPQAIDDKTNSIELNDLLHHLNNSDLTALFPVSQEFEKIENWVKREQTQEIINEIINNKKRLPICLHGGAGYGKSTIVRQIREQFPTQSKVILFDCYGGGTYLNPRDKRHRHQEALVQICNEMAKEIGSPFLIPSNISPHIYIREFISRIEAALKILTKKNSDAILTIIIDAADNSITAAEKDNLDSFVTDLANEDYPENFRLVFTSRTHRVNSLGLPENHICYLLKPFSLEESRENLLNRYPKSSKQEIKDFHNLSKGIPRVQSYLLDFKNLGIEEVINYLKPNGKTVEDIIALKINEAKKRIGTEGSNQVNSLFTYLINLPRPVPLDYLVSLTHLTSEQIKDITTDIWHGLILENELLFFRDEDFETYIRDKYEAKTTSEVNKKIAELFLKKADKEEYASKSLGKALFAAKEFEKLKSIVINNELSSIPVDPLRNREMFIERAKLAMEGSKETKDNLSFFKLLFIAAEAAKTDTALKTLLIDNADLVTSFGDNESMRKLNAISEKSSWAGIFHYQLAANYARNPETHSSAKTHLRIAEDWVSWLSKQKFSREERSERFHISTNDIAHGAEAVLHIAGIKAAVNWVNRWKPKKIRVKVFEPVFLNAIKYASSEQISTWLSTSNSTVTLRILILGKLRELEPSLNPENILNVIHRATSRELKLKIEVQSAIISICEKMMIEKTHQDKILEIVNWLTIHFPDRVPSFHHTINNEEEIADLAIRKKCIISELNGQPLSSKDFYPTRLLKKPKEVENRSEQRRIENNLERDKKTFDSFLNPAIRIYQFRLRTFIGINKKEVNQNFKELLSKTPHSYDLEQYHRPFSYNIFSFFAVRLIDSVPYLKDGKQALNDLIKSFEVKNRNVISLRLDIAKSISFYPSLQPFVYDLLNDVDHTIRKSPYSSDDMVDFYVKSAKCLIHYDKHTAKVYFEKAVEAISEVSYEAHHQIRTIERLSDIGIEQSSPELAFNFARFIEYSKSRLNYDKFPIREGFKGIANLDLPSAYSILSRWNHRDVEEISELIDLLLQKSIEINHISPKVGGALLALNSYHWNPFIDYLKLLLSKFDETKDAVNKTKVIEHLVNDIRINSHIENQKYPLREIFELVESGRLIKQDTVSNLKSYLEFIDSVSPKEDKYDRSPSFNKENNNKEINLDGLDYNSTESINQFLKSISNQNKGGHAPFQFREFLSVMKEEVQPNHYVEHLNAFIKISLKQISSYEFQMALKERLLEWSSHPLVEQWKVKNFEMVMRISFHRFNKHDYVSFGEISEYADWFSISKQRLQQFLIDFLPEVIQDFSASSIYETIGFLDTALSKNQNQELISWALRQLSSKIGDDFADGTWENFQYNSPSSTEAVGNLIRYILGHPDKRIRWRAVHSIRRMIDSGETTILEYLLEQQNSINCVPFQHKEYTFYWISAKLYLWIAILRSSQENPEVLINYKDTFYKELNNLELPHVLIIYLIRQTCLVLHKHDSSIFSQTELETINQKLDSKLEPTDEKKLERKQRKYASENDTWRFKFDTLDTINYSFDHLGDCFNLTGHDVADIADKYIAEKWGYVGEPWQDNHVNVNEYDYGLTSNSHGSVPTIERLSTYYEYHSMFCVAHDLLLSEPLWDDGSYKIYTWKEWIKSHTLTWKKYWLSDLIDPLPNESKFWKTSTRIFDKKWEHNIEIDEYDKAIGLSNDSAKKINLYTGFKRYFGENYESTSVRSVLVSTNTAESLCRAMILSASDHDYAMPLEKDEFTLNKDKFKLTGWLREVRSDRRSLDEDDPFSKDVFKNLIILGKTVKKKMNLTVSSDKKTTFCNDNVIATFKGWSNTTERKSYGDVETEGVNLEVDSLFLLSFLKEINMSMIVECKVSRQLEERDYSMRPEKRNEAKIYLIKQDGTVKTFGRRDFKIG